MKISRRAAIVGVASALLRPRLVHAQQPSVPIGDATPLTDLGMPLSAEQRSRGAEFLKRHVSVDIHSHPGRFFLRNLPFQTPTTRMFGEPFEAKAVSDLAAGGVSATVVAAVADTRLLEPTATGGLHAGHDFESGEVYSDYRAQLAQLKALLSDKRLIAGTTPRSIIEAQRRHLTAAVFAVEGGDFIEDRLARVHEAFSDGVRAITLVHYHTNQIGDIQTEAPVHRGLTPLGRRIVKEMNQAGMIIDLAHATFDVAKGVLEASARPLILSHSNLRGPGMDHPRLITLEHAQAVASSGGLIGAWPSGFGLASFADYIDAIFRLVDAVGVEHAGIGTDMDANFKPVLRSYLDWDLIPAALLARGMHEPEVAKLMGGNFQRVFAANVR